MRMVTQYVNSEKEKVWEQLAQMREAQQAETEREREALAERRKEADMEIANLHKEMQDMKNFLSQSAESLSQSNKAAAEMTKALEESKVSPYFESTRTCSTS